MPTDKCRQSNLISADSERPRGRLLVSIVCACFVGWVFSTAGGIALAFGGESCGAVMLLIFLAAVTPVMHGPTHTGDGSADKNQTEMIHMLKNLSIAGGLLVMLANRVETPAAPDTKTKTE